MSEALFESAQAILAGCDTAMSQRWREEDRQWREEDRRWRREDLDWRKQEEKKMESDYDIAATEKRWRAQDVEQRVLDNARLMWDRSVEKNRRAVEERAEQLKEVSNISALIAGFALIAFLEFSFDIHDTPTSLVYGFGLTTALTVGLMVNSMVTCSFMHASILKTGRKYVSEVDEATFIFRCRDFAKDYTTGKRPPVPSRSFELHWDQRCESEWRWAFYCFATGIPTFMLNLALAGLIKFYEMQELGIAIVAIVFMAFLVYLRSCLIWAPHLLTKGSDLYRDTFSIAAVGLPFDWHLLPISIDDQRANDHRETNNNRRQSIGTAYQEIAEETATDENTDGDIFHDPNEPVTNRQSPFLQRQTRSFNFTDVLRRSQTFHFQRKQPTAHPSTPWQDTLFAWIPNWMVQLLQQWMPKSESASQTVGSV